MLRLNSLSKEMSDAGIVGLTVERTGFHSPLLDVHVTLRDTDHVRRAMCLVADYVGAGDQPKPTKSQLAMKGLAERRVI